MTSVTWSEDKPIATLAVFGTVALTTGAVIGGSAGAGALAALIAGIALLWVPLATLPAIALAVFILVPTQLLPLDTQNGAINASLAVVLVLILRALVERRPMIQGAHAFVLVLFAAWVVASAMLSPLRSTSFAWSINFLALVIVPGLLMPGWNEAQRNVERWWLALGGLLGAYAVLELLLGTNPLLDAYTASGDAALLQTSEVYRVTTTLGHPLVSGTFFAIAAMLGVGRVVRGEYGIVLIATLLSAFGLVATASRGPTLGLVLGIVAFFLLGGWRLTAGMQTQTKVTAVLFTVFLAIGAYLYLGERANSDEAADSTATRIETLRAGQLMTEQYWPLGAGPGITDSLKRDLPIGDYERGVESSALQLAISLGLPGFLLAALITTMAGFAALRDRPELAACLVAYVVAGSTFNLLESNRPALLMWGLLIGIAVLPASACGRPSPLTPRHLEKIESSSPAA